MDRQKVAFYAAVNAHQGPYKENRGLIFDEHEYTWGVFDKKTGRFKAPRDGLYYIQVNIAAQSGAKAAVELMHNNDWKLRVWSEYTEAWAPASNSIVLKLQTGDQVYLTLRKDESCVYGNQYTTFSGFLLD